VKKSALDTPMMRQYLSIKEQHRDAIVFYRMGDFYEMFLEDAERAAPLLDIALTTRDRGKKDAVPMCGVPVHSADQYIKQLATLGHRVAICEQVENPKQTGGRRLVRREVVEVITPGLVGDPAGIEAKSEVALAALITDAEVAAGPIRSVGLAVLDASTGDFRATSLALEREDSRLPELVLEEIERVGPRELLLAPDRVAELAPILCSRLPDCVVTQIDVECFEAEGLSVAPEGFDSEGGMAMRAAAALLRYLGENQPSALAHAPRLRSYQIGDSVVLDAATRAHLELFQNGEDRTRRGTLYALLDRTRTALGARRLARWMQYPLRAPFPIHRRQEGVAWLAERDRVRARLREALAAVRDLERLLTKAARPTATPRDLGALRSSLQALPDVIGALAEPLEGDLFDTAVDERAGFEPPEVLARPEDLPGLTELLMQGLIDDPPVVARGSRGANETGYIRPGFRPELDALHERARKGREWIAGLEVQERERTGISTLKVRYHPVHGYSLEVPKSQLERVPEDYQRKQTLANVERFCTSELREVESDVMGANEHAAAIEREVFETLRLEVVAAASRIRAAALRVGELDALASLAEVARRERWVRPSVDEGEKIEIRAGRHPIVERSLRSAGSDGFVPNDTDLACDGTQILLLTGPNMSGKSTYLRQVALIVLMAQIGSFVPAEVARIGVVDRLFTRVGASDRLSRGESTFMVEMRETAEILRNASRRSLVILDEIGRGTSTFDGLSIAWAVAEYLHDTPGLEARTLFATHYHELIDLAQSKPRLRNAHFEAREWQQEVIFLRRLVEGGANRSYGIHVARLAGLPQKVVRRAQEILGELERGHREPISRAEGIPAEVEKQLSLGLESSGDAAAADEVLAEIHSLDPSDTTPMQALLALERWHGRLRGEG